MCYFIAFCPVTVYKLVASSAQCPSAAGIAFQKEKRKNLPSNKDVILKMVDPVQNFVDQDQVSTLLIYFFKNVAKVKYIGLFI